MEIISCCVCLQIFSSFTAVTTLNYRFNTAPVIIYLCCIIRLIPHASFMLINMSCHHLWMVFFWNGLIFLFCYRSVPPCLHGLFRFDSLCESGTWGTPTFLIATSVGITTCSGLGRRSTWLENNCCGSGFLFLAADTEGKSVSRWPQIWLSGCVNCPLRADGPIYFPMLWPLDSSCQCRRLAELPFPW